jgi:hypothetical protein
MSTQKKWPPWKRYGYLWVTLILFCGSMIGHWMFAWRTYVNEQEEHRAPVVVRDYVDETLRDTFENWQSEFLQLIWQVAGLAFLFHVGSPQSKESDDRQEEKIDLILAALDPKAEAQIKRLDAKYPRK